MDFCTTINEKALKKSEMTTPVLVQQPRHCIVSLPRDGLPDIGFAVDTFRRLKANVARAKIINAPDIVSIDFPEYRAD
jgi:hypothetical protein